MFARTLTRQEAYHVAGMHAHDTLLAHARL
jgi:hypothetical protein